MLHQGRLGRVQRGFVFRRGLDHGAAGSLEAGAGLSVTSNSPLRGSIWASTGAVVSAGVWPAPSIGAAADICAPTSFMLFAISAMGLFFLRSSISLRSSSSSAWRAISSKLLRNSLAMARALPAHLPAICIRRGKSFGPTTTSMTTSRMRICCQLNRSNMGRRPARGNSDRGLVLVGVFGVDHLGVVLLGQPLLEAVDAFAEVAHQVGHLATATEQDQGHQAQKHPMDPAQTTHDILLTH